MEKISILLYKILVIGVIVLFIGVGVQPAIAIVEPAEELIEIELKDYLFQTIIDIGNNLDVNMLLEQYDNDLFKVDIGRSVYRKLLLRNQRLILNTLFTKPSMSVEYLDKCYNNGIGITNVLSEDKVMETIENIEITDTKWLDELNNIIIKNEKLSHKFITLNEMNNNLNHYKSFEDTPVICAILFLIIMVNVILDLSIISLYETIFPENSKFWVLLLPYFIATTALWYPFIFLFVVLGCLDFSP